MKIPAPGPGQTKLQVWWDSLMSNTIGRLLYLLRFRF